MNKNIKNKAFTLVELLVVIAIIAVLATVSILTYTRFIDKAHKSNLEVELNQIQKLYSCYLLEQNRNEDSNNDYRYSIKNDLDNFVDYCYKNGVKKDTLNYCVDDSFIVNNNQSKIQKINYNKLNDNKKRFAVLLLQSSNNSKYYGSFNLYYQNDKLINTTSFQNVITKGFNKITKNTIQLLKKDTNENSWEYLITEDTTFQKSKMVSVYLEVRFDEYKVETYEYKTRAGKKIDKQKIDMFGPASTYYVSKENKDNFLLSNDGLYYFKADSSKWVDYKNEEYDFNKSIPLNANDFMLTYDAGNQGTIPEIADYNKVAKFVRNEFFEIIYNEPSYKKNVYYFDDLNTALQSSRGNYQDEYGKYFEEEVFLLQSTEVTNFHLEKNKKLGLPITSSSNGVEYGYDITNYFYAYGAPHKNIIDKTILTSIKPKINLTINGNCLCEGEINVGAKVMSLNCTAWGSKEGEVVPVDALLENEDYNSITINENSVLNISETGLINVYGKVYGKGCINNSGFIRELGNIKDLHGGTSIVQSYNNGVFPFRYYEFNHIETPITFTKTAYYDIMFYPKSGSGMGQPIYIMFISPENKNGLFSIEDGNIIKRLEDNKLIFDISGKVNDNHNDYIKDIAFPIQNFNINIKNGSIVNINHNNFKVLPNGLINIEKGAKVNLTSTLVAYMNFLLYSTGEAIDSTDYNGYLFYRREEVNEIKVGEEIYSEAKQTPGKIIVDGILDVHGENSILAGNVEVNGTLINNSSSTLYQGKEGQMNKIYGTFIEIPQYPLCLALTIKEKDCNLKKYIIDNTITKEDIKFYVDYIQINDDLTFSIIEEKRPINKETAYIQIWKNKDCIEVINIVVNPKNN